MGESIRLVVLVCEVLRAEHEHILRTEAWIKREKDILSDIHSVLTRNLLRKLEVVALIRRDIASGNLLAGDGIKAIEQVGSSVARWIAHTRPNSIVEML